MEKKLNETKEKLESSGCLLTKLILRRTNRVSEQLIKESEMELDKCVEIVQTSVNFFKDFSIDEVINATDIYPKLSKATIVCLQHFSKLKHSKYDFNRSLSLLEILCSNIFAKMISILKERNILLIDMESLKTIKKQSDELFSTWETQLVLQRNMLKDIAKRRNEKMRPLFLQYYEPLQQRLKDIFMFRENHEKLLHVFSNVLISSSSQFTSNNTTSTTAVTAQAGSGENENSTTNTGNSTTTNDGGHYMENELINELNDAYRSVIKIENDVFDLTPNGMSLWLSAQDVYERRLEKVELQMTRLLETRLNNSKSAEDMFRVFAIFNPLFFRSAIRNAVNSFRTSLVKNVAQDVSRLQAKFKLRYDESLEKQTADLRDIPPLAGQIIWAKQIENQLNMLMKRLEDVLGIDWGDHFEGNLLYRIIDMYMYMYKYPARLI